MDDFDPTASEILPIDSRLAFDADTDDSDGARTPMNAVEMELSAVLGERLTAPVVIMDELLRGRRDEIRDHAEEVVPAIDTLGDVLQHERAPLRLLRMVKSYAKIAHRQPTDTMPRGVSRALYFAAIAAALKQYRQLISTLEPAQLISAMRHWRDCRWMKPEVASLFDDAIKQLREWP